MNFPLIRGFKSWKMHFLVQNTTIRIGYFTTQMGVIFFEPYIFIEVTTPFDKFQKIKQFHSAKKKNDFHKYTLRHFQNSQIQHFESC